NTKRSQQANTGMGAQASNADIALALGLEPPHGLQQLLIEWLHQLPPMFAFPVHDRRHLRRAGWLLTLFSKQPAALGQARLQSDGLQTVFAHGPDLDQLL